MKIKSLCNYLIIGSLVLLTCGCSNSISIMENSTKVSAGKLNNRSKFEISLSKLKTYINETNKIKNINSDTVIYNNLEIVRLIQNILKDSKTNSYNNIKLSKLLGMKVYKVNNNNKLRVIQYKTNKKIHGETNAKTYQFVQDTTNSQNEVSVILNGENEEYNKFFYIKFNAANKILCVGSDYSINSKRALVTVYDNSKGVYELDNSIINPVEEKDTNWSVNMIDYTISLGNALEEGTYVSNVYKNGREIEVSPTEECINYIGYNPGKLKFILKDEYGYIPSIQ